MTYIDIGHRLESMYFGCVYFFLVAKLLIFLNSNMNCSLLLIIFLISVRDLLLAFRVSEDVPDKGIPLLKTFWVQTIITNVQNVLSYKLD